MKLTMSRDISAPIEAVFAAVTDVAGHAERIPAITKC